ncbi:MAG: hydroxyectoine utilization dehydratase EutB [Acidimicrobiia bacterium]
MPADVPHLADIGRAAERIRGIATRTPIVDSPDLAEVAVSLKLETIQPTGSFKIRGAASRIRSLPESDRARGVVTASTGNHGRAVAHVARSLGIEATVCVSEGVPAGKVAALEALGCELVVDGASQSEALVNAHRLVSDRGMTLIHPFDDPDVIAGQGTIGIELLDQVPDVTTVLVPLSGGGLAAGVATAIKETDPTIRVIGISMQRSAVMAASLAAGEPVDMPERPTLADSLQGGIGLDNRYTFGIVQQHIDEVVLLDEREIWQAMLFALQHHRLVLEGGAAVGIGALLAGKVVPTGPTAVICTGSNVEPRHLAELADELSAAARRDNGPD